MELGAMMSRAPADESVKAQADPGQPEAEQSFRREVAQRYFFAALQKATDLLVGRGAPEIGVLEILGDKRPALPLPSLVVGAGQLHTRLPVAGDRAKARGWAFVARRTNRVSGVLYVRDGLARSGVGTDSGRIERIASVTARQNAAPGTLVTYGTRQ